MAVLLGGVGGVGVGAGWLAGVSPPRRSAWRSSSGVSGVSGSGRVGWPGSAPLDVAHGGPPRGCRGGGGRGGLAGRGQPHSTWRMAVHLGGGGGGGGGLGGVGPAGGGAWRGWSGVSGTGGFGWPGSAPLDVAHGGPPRGWGC